MTLHRPLAFALFVLCLPLPRVQGTRCSSTNGSFVHKTQHAQQPANLGLAVQVPLAVQVNWASGHKDKDNDELLPWNEILLDRLLPYFFYSCRNQAASEPNDSPDHSSSLEYFPLLEQLSLSHMQASAHIIINNNNNNDSTTIFTGQLLAIQPVAVRPSEQALAQQHLQTALVQALQQVVQNFHDYDVMTTENPLPLVKSLEWVDNDVLPFDTTQSSTTTAHHQQPQQQRQQPRAFFQGNRIHEYMGLFYFAAVVVLAYYATQLASREPWASWIQQCHQRKGPRNNNNNNKQNLLPQCQDVTECSESSWDDDDEENQQELVEVRNPYMTQV